MYVFMYIYMYVFIYRYVCVWIHTCMYGGIFVEIQSSTVIVRKPQ